MNVEQPSRWRTALGFANESILRIPQSWTLSICIVLTGLIFWVDLSIPLGVAGGVPYVLPILISAGLPKNRRSIILACVCSALTIIAFFYSPPGGELWKIVSNRFLALFAIWVTTIQVVVIKQAGQALESSRERLYGVLNSTSDAIISIDMTGITQSYNPAAARIFGYSEQEMLGSNFSERVVHNSERAAWRDALAAARVAHHDPPLNGHVHIRGCRSDATEFLLDIAVTLNVLHEESTFTIVASDISRQEEEKANQKLLQKAIEQASESICITDPEGTIEYVNPAFEKTTGYTHQEVIGQNPRMLQSGTQNTVFYKAMWDTLLQGETWRGQFTNMKKDGSTYTSEASISPVRDGAGETVNYISLQRDITHERQLERQLLQAQKMESIGTMAGGIAHDFNNILQAILGFCKIAQENKSGNTELLTQCLEEIEAGGRRAADLVGQILTFSRTGEAEFIPLTLQPLVEEALRFLRSSIPATIRIDSTINPDCAQVVGDPTQIHQVVTNLCTNAMHAMEEEGGILTVSLEPLSIDSSLETLSGPLEPGDYIELLVADTGTGIEARLFERLLDPFFTTKEVGKGTGLGLAVVHGIVKKMGGGLSIESTVGEGTTVRVMLPVLGEDLTIRGFKDSTQTDLKGSCTIIIVDDEKAITRLTTLMLRDRGFTVESFNDVDEALEAVESNSRKYDVALLDYTMPGKTGLELARDFQSLNPEMPVIIATGLLEKLDLEQNKSPNITGIIEKPFDVDDLVAAINRSL